MKYLLAWLVLVSAFLWFWHRWCVIQDHKIQQLRKAQEEADGDASLLGRDIH